MAVRRNIENVQNLRSSKSISRYILETKITQTHTGENDHHKEINKQVLVRLWRKGNPNVLLVGMQTGAATVENSMEFPQKTKDGTAF